MFRKTSSPKVAFFTIISRQLLTSTAFSVFPDLAGQGVDISSLSLSRMDAAYSTYLVLGFWSTHEVRVYSLPHFDAKSVVKLPQLPRSSVLYNFSDNESQPRTFLVIGTAGGNVAYSSFKKGVIGEMKSVPLGDSPVLLSVCDINGPAILASGWNCSVRHDLLHGNIIGIVAGN